MATCHARATTHHAQCTTPPRRPPPSLRARAAARSCLPPPTSHHPAIPPNQDLTAASPTADRPPASPSKTLQHKEDERFSFLSLARVCRGWLPCSRATAAALDLRPQAWGRRSPAVGPPRCGLAAAVHTPPRRPAHPRIPPPASANASSVTKPLAHLASTPAARGLPGRQPLRLSSIHAPLAAAGRAAPPSTPACHTLCHSAAATFRGLPHVSSLPTLRVQRIPSQAAALTPTLYSHARRAPAAPRLAKPHTHAAGHGTARDSFLVMALRAMKHGKC
jgi:hypothetical protein